MSLFESLVPAVTAEMVDNLAKHAESMDLKQLRTAQLLYDNATDPERPPSVSNESFFYRELAWTPVAFTSMVVDKIASMLYSRNVTRTTGNEGWDTVLERGPWRQLRRMMLRVSKVASIQGYDVIRLRPVYSGGVAYASMGIGNATPILDPDDPHGPPLGMLYDYMDEPMLAQINRSLGGSSTQVHVKEVITRHVRDKDGAITYPGIHGRLENGELVEMDNGGYNLLGDYLDCILWRGADHPTDGRGRSDILPVIKTLTALNEGMTDAHELLIWNVWPPWITDDANADVRYSPRTLIKLGDNASGESASLQRLEWSGREMAAWKDYFEKVTGLVHETTRVPAVSTGDMGNIGQLSSGRAYEIAMTPLLELTREKETVATEQEIDLIETTLAMLAYYDHINGMTARNEYTGIESPDPLKIIPAMDKASVEFEPVRLPKDKMAEAEIRSVLRGAGIESTEQAIRTLHPEWPDERVAEELQKVGADEPETVDASADIRIKQAQEKLRQEAE